MTWLDQLHEIGAAIDEEFTMPAVMRHMIGKVNSRAQPHPDRPAYHIVGEYTENARHMGTGRQSNDGMKHTWLTSSRITYAAQSCVFKWPPTQGDALHIPSLNRFFRVLDIETVFAGRTLLVLEDIEAIPA